MVDIEIKENKGMDPILKKKMLRGVILTSIFILGLAVGIFLMKLQLNACMIEYNHCISSCKGFLQ